MHIVSFFEADIARVHPRWERLVVPTWQRVYLVTFRCSNGITQNAEQINPTGTMNPMHYSWVCSGGVCAMIKVSELSTIQWLSLLTMQWRSFLPSIFDAHLKICVHRHGPLAHPGGDIWYEYFILKVELLASDGVGVRRAEPLLRFFDYCAVKRIDHYGGYIISKCAWIEETEETTGMLLVRHILWCK